MSSLQLSSISLSMVIFWTDTHIQAPCVWPEEKLQIVYCRMRFFVVLRKTEMDRSIQRGGGGGEGRGGRCKGGGDNRFNKP